MHLARRLVRVVYSLTNAVRKSIGRNVSVHTRGLTVFKSLNLPKLRSALHNADTPFPMFDLRLGIIEHAAQPVLSKRAYCSLALLCEAFC